MTQQKATPIHPPIIDPNLAIVDVDMTRVYWGLYTLGFTATTLAVSNVWLWRKHIKNEQYMEAMKEFVSRMVKTDCGSEAYNTLLDGAALEDNEVADWSDFDDEQPIPYEVAQTTLNDES